MMTEQDYIKFAEMIAKRKFMHFRMDFIQKDMIELFKQDNPSFDADRFNAYIDKRVEELTLTDLTSAY